MNCSSDERERLLNFGLSKLKRPTYMNTRILINHLFHLKLNEDFVINTIDQVESLVEYINSNVNE
jgi:hypothetical protein